MAPATPVKMIKVRAIEDGFHHQMFKKGKKFEMEEHLVNGIPAEFGDDGSLKKAAVQGASWVVPVNKLKQLERPEDEGNEENKGNESEGDEGNEEDDNLDLDDDDITN